MCAYNHSHSNLSSEFTTTVLNVWEVIDGRVIRAGISVTWNVLSWSGGHELEPQSDGTLGV